jgi:hypothetical protein
MTIRKKELKELKKSELKDMCKELGLQVSGNKKVLVDRILWKEYREEPNVVIAKVRRLNSVDIIEQKRSFDNSSVSITRRTETRCGDFRGSIIYPGLNPEEAAQKVRQLTTEEYRPLGSPATAEYGRPLSGINATCEQDYYNCDDEWFGPGPAALRD